MKKIKYLCFIFTGCLFLFFGCGNGKEAVESSEKETIVIWTWDETFNVKAAKMAAAEYEKEHSDVQIVIETKEREEILSDTKTILAAKVYENLPDVIMIEDYDVQEVLSLYEDEFVELTDKINYEKYAGYKSQLCSKDGHMYGIPFDSGTAALFYRLDILEQAGYTEGDMHSLTWDEYIEIGKNVYKKTGIPMLTLDPTDFPLVRLIMQSNGCWYVKQDGSTADIENNVALEQALEIYKELLEQNIGISVNGWNEFISAFQQGEVASVMSGGWIISSIKEKEEQAGLWRVTTIPVVSENENAVAASNVGGSSWYVLNNSANPELATEFMVAMFGENEEFIDSLIGEIGLIPAVKEPAVYSYYGEADAFFGGQQVTRILTRMADRIPTVNYGSKTYEIEDIIEEEFQSALSDGNLKGCLERAQMKAEAVAKE